MTDINTNTEMASFDASRRTMLKKTVAVAGVAAVAPAVSFASSSNKKDDAELDNSPQGVQARREKFVSKILRKYASKSKRIKPEYIDGFAKGFVELNGDIDYEQSFHGLKGEYRLVKLFIRSVNSSRLPA